MVDKTILERGRLQFISHEAAGKSYLGGCLAAIEGGCRWVQLRMKDAADEDVAAVAAALVPAARRLGVTLILDDRVELCRRLRLDGVHLGKTDMPPREARGILGPGFIIGGTCNTADDIRRIAGDVDYIGCGPLRYTETKKNLAPTLGIEGYSALRRASGDLFMVAIGGIRVADVAHLLAAGASGVAVSGDILRSGDPAAATRAYVRELDLALKKQKITT